jgi:hypothetical protein
VTVGVTKWDVLLVVTVSLCGCKGSNDTVLQPDRAAGSGVVAVAGMGAGMGAGGQAGAPSSAAGSSAAKPPAAGSSTTGTAGAAGTGSTAAGTGGAAGKAGASGISGTAGSSGGAGAAGGTGGTGAAGEGEAGAAGAMAGAGAADPECDFTGIWIAKQATVSEALQIAATSNNWYYLEFKQSGTDVEVSKHYDCGIEVTGIVSVKLAKATLEALLPHNVQTGRKATLVRDGNNCKFESARFWSIRGGDDARYLPNATRDSEQSIKQVAMEKPLPTTSKTDGAIDVDNDGKLGVGFQVSGIVSGTRNSVQRDWTKWFTEPGFEIAASADWKNELKIRADFDNEESILDPPDGPLASGSTPKGNSKHTLRLRFLGRDASDPRVAQIVKSSQVDTCFAIQDAFPAETLE